MGYTGYGRLSYGLAGEEIFRRGSEVKKNSEQLQEEHAWELWLLEQA